MEIDAHFHVWDLQHFEYAWPTADNPPLFKNYSLADYEKACSATSVRHAIFVQVRNNSPEEAKWILCQAEKHPIIKGVVAGLDVTGPEFQLHLEELGRDSRFVGVRHILDFEDESWLTRADVDQGLSLLEKHDKTFDLLLRPHLLKYVPPLAAAFPRLRFMVDHIAKPNIKEQILNGWKEDMTRIAQFPNMYCKISGLIPEADGENWKQEDFTMYIQHILDIFGEDRCIFGSDWPVLHVSPKASYETVYKLTKDLLTSYSVSDEGIRKIFSQNAINFYKLKV